MTMLEVAALAALPLCALALALSPQIAPAHHSAAMYDLSRVVTVQGTVSKYDWRNPHVYIYVEEVTERGERQEWKVEGLPTTVMQRLDWNAQTLQPGERIDVQGYATRNSESKGLAPTLIVRGAQDTLVPAAHAEAYASAIEGARLVEVERAAHLLAIERPDELARLVRDFLGVLEGTQQ